MKLHNTHQNEAVLSNVGEIGEFRIRNSAKAFNILSSGLYANKIKAIIRELSCNAVDSHTAAGNIEQPFEIHLPNSLEPWFSIRDFGTGLTHEQVTQIYTTYFESTKTGSNDFIGALGLGSKSPFSYTDNFTVTAVRDGRKGIYTAFINESGVPSIALMMEEATDEAAGVEVKFSVDDRYHFDKFRHEAQAVYKYFKQRPVVRGVANFTFEEPDYTVRDIIPGVHSVSGYCSGSVAIMGNIAYPIDIPHADQSIGDLRYMLGCGLVMEFDIGELDFQASREGLSYIPETVEAIRRKLEALNAQLSVHIATEADKIGNLWDRAVYLSARGQETLWKAAVIKYVTDTSFPLIDANASYRYDNLKNFQFSVKELEEKFNIKIRGFHSHRGQSTVNNAKASSVYNRDSGHYVETWSMRVSANLHFVINDTKTGATERAKYHWKQSGQQAHTETVLVLEPVDKTKPMDTAQFFSDIMDPPATKIHKASSLKQRERATGVGRNVTILKLAEREVRRGYRYTSEVTWQAAGTVDTFDEDETYYYLPLSGFVSLGRVQDVKELYAQLKAGKIYTGEIYGVRKADIQHIKEQKNWKNLDELVVERLTAMGNDDVMSIIKSSVDLNTIYFNKDVPRRVEKSNPDSPYLGLWKIFKDVKEADSRVRMSVESLCDSYGIQTKTNIDPTALISKYNQEVRQIVDTYPLLKSISHYCDDRPIAQYIELIDSSKTAENS